MSKIKQTIIDKTSGMKETEIGWLPVEWEVRKLKDIARTYSGGSPSRERKEYWGGDIPWLKSGELNNKRVFYAKECIPAVTLPG